MQSIEFETPNLDRTGEIITMTQHTAEQFTECWRWTQTSLWGFESFARGLLKAGYTREALVYPKSTEASYATRANRG